MLGDGVDADVTGAASVGTLPYSSADGMVASSVVAKTSPGFFIHRRGMKWITPPQVRQSVRSARHAPTECERARDPRLANRPTRAGRSAGVNSSAEALNSSRDPKRKPRNTLVSSVPRTLGRGSRVGTPAR
jgi:hypothetical protein